MRSIEEKGFTVLEVIVATAISGVLLLSLVTLVNSLNVVNDRARDLTIVNALAENKIESLRSVSYVGLADGVTDFTDELPDFITGAKSATYTLSSPTAGIRQMDMTISFQDRGATRTLTYRTLIGELGVGQY